MQYPIIPIVYASDEHFLEQTYVSIYSVLTNRTSDYELKFYILIPENCEHKRYNEYWDFSGYSIEYITVSADYFRDIKMQMQHISKPTYYRLLIPIMLSEYDKCLYLDGDIICLTDIKELYDKELENNLLAAAMGAIIPFNAKLREETLGIPDARHYINAGVLVMNLKQMREENKTEEFLLLSKKEFPCQDQDVLNISCYRRIKLLPLKYNVYSTAFNLSVEMLLERYGADEIREAFISPSIIHYPGEYTKPWNNLQCVKGKEWWNYAVLALDQRSIDSMQAGAKKWAETYSYDILFEKIKSCNQLVLFGFSEIGKSFCDQIDEKYPGKVVCFCDNAKNKAGSNHKSHKVISVSDVKKRYPDALIVITSQRYSAAIQKQLLEEGFHCDQLQIYRQKTMKYVYSMDKNYWDKAAKEIQQDSISLAECTFS